MCNKADLRVKRSGESRKAFGAIYDHLAHYQSDDTELVPLRDLLRDSILENWAIAPGTNVLGEVLSVRRLHSVASAAEETEIDPKALTRVLSPIGALTGANFSMLKLMRPYSVSCLIW